jgi:PAS domain-containing protein
MKPMKQVLTAEQFACDWITKVWNLIKDQNQGTSSISKSYFVQSPLHLGHPTTIECSARVFSAAADEARILMSISDQTVREEAAQKLLVQVNEVKFQLQRIHEMVPVGIFHTDLQGGCVYVNQKWEEMYGQSAEEAAGFGWARSIFPEDAQRVSESWNRQTSSKE